MVGGLFPSLAPGHVCSHETVFAVINAWKQASGVADTGKTGQTMRIEHRDSTLTYPPAIHHDKRRLVLNWLLEFRFSSYELLARRIGSTPAKAYPFFRALKRKGLVQEFSNVYTGPQRFLMLTRTGVGVLDIDGRDTSKAMTHPHRLERNAHILHDFAVQAAVLKRQDDYDEVIWDQHIQIPEQFEKPDALLRGPEGYWVALEYERSRKESKRIYIAFRHHAKALLNRHYSGVYYVFDRESHRAYYQTLFAAPEWPEYHYNRKTGKITPTHSDFKPDSVKNLRQAFRFLHEPYPNHLASP